jgi:hypothetical protein
MGRDPGFYNNGAGQKTADKGFLNRNTHRASDDERVYNRSASNNKGSNKATSSGTTYL